MTSYGKCTDAGGQHNNIMDRYLGKHMLYRTIIAFSLGKRWMLLCENNSVSCDNYAV